MEVFSTMNLVLGLFAIPKNQYTRLVGTKLKTACLPAGASYNLINRTHKGLNCER
jgi:hypothetical protein